MKEGENICLKPERHMTVLTTVRSGSKLNLASP